MDPTRVLLADDHELVRAGLRALLERLPDITVVGEASDGREALRQIETLAPNVVLMDVMMPELNGLDATARGQPVSEHAHFDPVDEFGAGVHHAGVAVRCGGVFAQEHQSE